MASTNVNIMRWGAMVFGIFYGFSHQQTISARDASAAAQREYDQRAKLIDQARAEFKRKNTPAHERQGGEVNTDLTSPNFDLEAYLMNTEKSSQ